MNAGETGEAEYDRLVAKGGPSHAARAAAADRLGRIATRTPPEIRERILAMLKVGNPKYGKPFDKDELAGISLIGTQSWADYGQVVLDMAILDRLLSIEEKRDRIAEKP